MTFERVHKYVTYAIAALGLYALSLGNVLGASAVMLTWAAFVLSWFAERPLTLNPQWARSWTIAVIGFFAIQVWRGTLGASFLQLGLEYAAFLQVSRLMNRRTGKDHDQITVLAFLHLIAATVLTTSVAYGLVFIGFLIVTPWALTATHLRREVEETPAFTPPEREAMLGAREIVGSRFLLTTALLTVPIFFVTVGLFVAFPRVGLGLATVRGSTGEPTTGFGRNVELGGFGTIREDPTVVLRVSAPAAALGPPGTAAIRMRGTSFDQYNGRTWLRSGSESWATNEDFGAYPIVRHPDRAHDFEYKVVLDQLDEPVIFLPEGTIAISIPPRLSVGREISRRIRGARGFDFRYDERETLGLSYSAFVSRDPHEWRKGELDLRESATLRNMPPGLERVKALAEQVTAGATSDRERAALIQRYLRDSGTYRYTLTLPNTEGRDPLLVFLFEAKAGHCEYFSTAMAMMLRAVGIPSRNVSGFYGGAYNEYGKYYSLRRADAHSWVEGWVGNRWQTFDPTPSSRNAMGPADTFLSPIRDFLDAMRTRWAHQVVGYDLRIQTQALRNAMRWTRQLKNWFKGSDSTGSSSSGQRAEKTSASKNVPWLGLTVAVFAVFLALGLFWRRRTHRAELAAIPPRSRLAVALYRELEDALAHRGVARAPDVTPLEHVERLEADAFEGVEHVRTVTARYVDARFGSGSLTPEEVQGFRAIVRRVRAGPRAREMR